MYVGIAQVSFDQTGLADLSKCFIFAMNNDSVEPETLLAKFSNGLTYFMQKAKDQLSSLDSPRDLLRFVLYPSALSSGGPLTFLGRTYPSIDDISFLDGSVD